MKQKLIKSAITVVSIVLAISLVGLAFTLIEYYLSGTETAYVVVPDNYIKEASEEMTVAHGRTHGGGMLMLLSEVGLPADYAGSETYASLLRFDSSVDELNRPFEVKNMFPGDEETKYYLACVTFKDRAVLKFQATVRDGYEKLAEVLKIRVEQISEDKLLYDGLMSGMPVLTDTELSGKGKTTVDVYYKITVYLETSVGNEYMKKELVADFSWWIEEDEEETKTTERKTTHKTSEKDTTAESTHSSETRTETESESETESETETDTTEATESEEKTSVEESTTDDHEHAPQTSDSTMLRLRIPVIVGIIAFLMLLLMLLLMLGEKNNEKKQ